MPSPDSVPKWLKIFFYRVDKNTVRYFTFNSKDGVMTLREPSSGIRKGQFLWMDPAPRSRYLDTLRKKISSGYYYSDQVLTSIVDDIAPLIDEVISGKQITSTV